MSLCRGGTVAFSPSMARRLPYLGCLYRRQMLAALWMLLLLLPVASAASNLPLLSGTLRTFQVHACDGDELKVECWPNTVISINLAQYGRQVPSYQLCPTDALSSNYGIENDTINCLASEALRTVEEACREQRVCRVKTSPVTFGTDPCPGIRKYAEVAYKCRPNTFLNKVICEGDRLRLRCHKALRIVIYSAAFGATHYGVPECPQEGDAVAKDCQVSYATETVMSSCHGRRKCSIGADVGTFGSPGCPQTTRLFLKVVYTCVPRDILKDLDLGGSEENGKDQEDSDYTGFIEEPRYAPVTPKQGSDGILDYTAVDSKVTIPPKYYPEDEKEDGLLVKTTMKTDMQSDENTDEDGDANSTTLDGDQKVIGFLTEWISAYKFVRDNKERFILYTSLSLTVGLVVFLAVVATRLYLQKRRTRRPGKMPMTEPMHGTFAEECSDLDHFDPRGPVDNNVEVVRYGTRSSMRRQDSDTYPRAPVSRATNNYYYS